MAYPYQQYQQPGQMDPAVMRAKDEGDLNLLATLHYVWSGLMGCSAFAIVGYFVMIAAFISNAPHHAHPSAHAAHDQEMAEGIMMVFGIIMGLVMIGLMVLHILAAAGLKKRTRYTLALVMSGFACLSVPLGTGLGIWTIIVLQRPGVKALFGR